MGVSRDIAQFCQTALSTATFQPGTDCTSGRAIRLRLLYSSFGCQLEPTPRWICRCVSVCVGMSKRRPRDACNERKLAQCKCRSSCLHFKQAIWTQRSSPSDSLVSVDNNNSWSNTYSYYSCVTDRESETDRQTDRCYRGTPWQVAHSPVSTTNLTPAVCFPPKTLFIMYVIYCP